MLIYMKLWQAIVMSILLVILGMALWRSIHNSCVYSHARKAAKFKRQRNHLLFRARSVAR